MMEFTEEEISLCKQVAEKHKKEIGHGDWIYIRKKRIICGIPLMEVCLVDGNYLIPKKDTMLMEKYLINEFGFSDEGYRQISRLGWFPLWTISDCLKFLRKKDYRINLHENVLTNGIEVILNHPKRIEDITNYVYKGKTPLEACLRAVLAVLEEGR